MDNIVRDPYIKYGFMNIPSGDLRLAITPECNMRCTYCHAEGNSGTRMLSFNEIKYIICNSMQFGVRSISITGGEPTMHPSLLDVATFVKCTYPKCELSINTNGTNRSILQTLASKGLVDRIVFGIDYFDRTVSKDSPIGSPSKTVFETILLLKDQGSIVEVDSVFVDNYKDHSRIIKWCLDHSIHIKSLEIIDDEVSSSSSVAYCAMRESIISTFNLTRGKKLTTGDIYGVSENGTIVSFYRSLCRVRQCTYCSRMHLRITSSGNTKPCLKSHMGEINLLEGDFYKNMMKCLTEIRGCSKNDI